jgi:MOSC domain-containing protein YiiM
VGLDGDQPADPDHFGPFHAVYAFAQEDLVRIPCSVFKGWVALAGYDDTAWVKRFADEGRPGPYLRVLEPGHLQAGDPLRVEHRPGHDVTVSTMFAALTTRRDLLPRLADLDRIDPEALEAARAYVGTNA